MLANATVITFLATRDPERSRRFYAETLGLPLKADDGFALVFDANGIELRVQKVDRVEPHAYTALGWRVADISVKVAGLARGGVAFERYQGMTQDPSGVWQAPSGARVAWFKDPDGNLLSLTQG
ncbi:MAG TPA: VOC family protein [Gemmatimonadales bacterium]|nr:VOC family protein [Gemmatimonadales bacterium]